VSHCLKYEQWADEDGGDQVRFIADADSDVFMADADGCIQFVSSVTDGPKSIKRSRRVEKETVMVGRHESSTTTRFLDSDRDALPPLQLNEFHEWMNEWMNEW